MVVMATTRRVCLALACLLAFAAVGMGQAVSKEFCKRIENSVAEGLGVKRVDTRDVYGDRCVFEFTLTTGDDLSLTVEEQTSEEAASNSLHRFLELIAILGQGLEGEKDLPFAELDTNNGWDEVRFLKTTGTGSGILSLRRGKFGVTVLAPKDGLLVQTEKLLRDQTDLKEQ